MKKLIIANAICSVMLLSGSVVLAEDESEKLASSMGLLKAEDIEGADVWNLQKEKVGDIDCLLVDYSGNVRFAVLSVGGFIGINDRKVAVPWSAVRVGADPAGSEASFFLDATKDRLTQAPVYDAETYRQLLVPTNAKPIYTFWKVEYVDTKSTQRQRKDAESR